MPVSDEYRLIVELSTSSASLAISPKENWIERVPNGQLPPYVRKLARAIEKHGHTLSSAISIAIGRCKAWSSGQGKVTAKTRAKAAAAVAQWEALKAKNAARHIVKASAPQGDYLFETNVGSFNTEIVRGAWDRQHNSDDLAVNPVPYKFIKELWTDFLIYQDGENGHIYKVPYTVDSGDVTFGDPERVKVEFVPDDSEDLTEEEQALIEEHLAPLNLGDIPSVI